MNLMLADDHPLFVEGLQYLLESYNIKVAAVAVNGRDAYLKARKLKPDIILMDIAMPEISGLNALKLIKAEMPEIKIVMLTASEADDDLFEAIKCGASGYLLKNTNAQELIEMLSAVEKGEVPFSAGLAGKLLKELGGSNVGQSDSLKQLQADLQSSTLTERQLQVLEKVAKGCTYKEVGEDLGLTERTVKYHMGRIISLLHMENRSQVIAYAARTGLVNMDNEG